MFCPRCGTVASADSGLCARCGGNVARPRQNLPDPPAVRAPTNRGEGAQRAAGIDARPLPKAAVKPRPAAVEPAPAQPSPADPAVAGPTAPPAWPSPAEGSSPAPPPTWSPAPAGSPPPAPPSSWPPPPAAWEPAGSGRWAPPEGRPAGQMAPGAEANAAWSQQPPAPPTWSPARPPSGWVRPSGSWWDRVFGSPSTAEPRTYFWQSLVCLFLFLPTGVAAVAYSLLASRRQQTGDRMGSLRASQLARLWCLITLGVFAVAVLVTAAAGLQS